MKPNLLGIILLMTGSVFIYSGIKDKDPRDVVREALKQPPKYSQGSVNNAISGQSIPVAATPSPSNTIATSLTTGVRYPITSV